MYGKNFDSKKWIIEKISYDRRAYESVDDRGPLLGYISTSANPRLLRHGESCDYM